MSRPTKSDVVVWYKGPGDEKWRVSEEERRVLRRRARQLLAKVDEGLRREAALSRRREEEYLGLEREMAAALGAWDRWVRAGTKEIYRRSQHVVEEAGREAWDAVRRAFKVEDE